jgi:hypothetical protein
MIALKLWWENTVLNAVTLEAQAPYLLLIDHR